MRVETERLYLYPISNREMQCLIDKENDIEMKQAYTEMLEGCLKEPDNRIWHAVWNMELKNTHGTIVGDFGFKGLGKDGIVEIGYGLKEKYRHQGYMTETVKVITEWALSQEGVCSVEAETNPENVASQNVLRRAGYVKNGIIGKEGPRFVYKGIENERTVCRMNYIRITKENIDKEHICCAMSGKQSLAKKEWLRHRFEEGLVFYRSVERRKCFIEYIPAENAWVPIEADGYLYINCLWVSGSMKGHGYSTDLLDECIRDAKAQDKKGVCILCAEGRKREFLADPKFLVHKGFHVADIADCGINLMYLSLSESAELPKFKECAKHPRAKDNGYVLYYTDQCPYTYYWVPKVEEVAKEHHIPFRAIHITTKEAAQNVSAPVTTYALFRDGEFLTQSIQSDKKFLALTGVKA